jgi:4-diphosphocytidyl-2-C-methyl-D-erythritol kinase
VTTLIARAKLTWSLAVTGVRHDGYHLLDAEMIELDLADELELTTTTTTSVRWSGPFAQPAGPDLVERALAVCSRHASVAIKKAIPPGGGLGGGSADAAAILRWAGQRDLGVALQLGADVPFCVVGGRARVRGVGELVEPLSFVARDVTVLLAPFGVSTQAVFARYDIQVDEGRTPKGRNELTGPACAVEPRLATLLDWAAALTSREAVLAGSGSTVFVEGHFPEVVGVLASPVGPVTAVQCRAVPGG